MPDVEGYDELLDKLTFAFMDGELPTEETIRKFAEPYSPPAPPPPVIVRRSRAVKRVTEPKKAKGRKAAKSAAVAPNGDLSLAAAGEARPVGALAEQNGMAGGKSESRAAKGAEKAAAAKAAAKPEPAKKAEKAAKGASAAKGRKAGQQGQAG